MQIEIREFKEHTDQSALNAIVSEFPMFTSYSKAPKTERHDYVMYGAGGSATGFVTIVTKADIKKGWASPESLGSSLRIIRHNP